MIMTRKYKNAAGGDSAGGNMSAVTCLRARDRQESGYKGPDLAMQLLLYPETGLPFNTKAGSENCTGYYLETSGVLLFAWNMLPQGQVHTHTLHTVVVG